MNSCKIINTHYLSISYRALITNKIVHYILFILEIYLILMQVLEIYFNDFKSFKKGDISYFTTFTQLILLINKIPIEIKFIIYIVVIIFLIINGYILNNFNIKESKYITIIINLTELLFYRLLSLFIFNYLFSFEKIYFLISVIITIPYTFQLVFSYSINHLFFFFPNLIEYPYDNFSMLIDLHLLGIKILLSISAMNLNDKISKFFFMLSIIILLILLFYLTYIMLYKSYYLMNNCNLNRVRYSLILTFCLIIFFILIIRAKEINNIYCFICYINILLLCLFFICCFYDPYRFSIFYDDSNSDNAYFYFFILNRNKNKYLLIEEKIEEHISRCNTCNLCKKYDIFKNEKESEEIDLYYVIYNGKNIILNLMNEILRGIKKSGKKCFVNNSYYIINIIYIYCLAINQKKYNIILNIELLFVIINIENSHFLEEYNICLSRIKYTNNFLIKAKNLIDFFYQILEEKNEDKKIQKFFKFGEFLNELKYKEIKSNINNMNIVGIEKLPNCNNLITICSLLYEELYNESLSNSGIYIRDSPNIIEDLINNNLKYKNHITLEINIQNFNVKIIRAGGDMHIYENNNLFDLFPAIFKNGYIIEFKNILLHSNDNSQNKLNNNKVIKGNEKEKNFINFNFIIEEKEDNIIFYRNLKLKLNLILLNNINIIFYLNGIYIKHDDIIVTEYIKGKEILFHFGNKEQIQAKNNFKSDKIIKKNENERYFCNKKLIKDNACFIGNNKYNVYHFLSISKNSLYLTKSQKNFNNMHSTEEQEAKSNYRNSNNKIMVFNDISSQTSTNLSSMSKNNLISYNRGSKQNQSDEEISKEFKIGKYILLLSILGLFISLIFEYIYMKKSYKRMTSINEFYLILQDYRITFNIIFFSSLSLTCIGNSTNSDYCVNIMDKITKEEMNKFKTNNNTNTDNITLSENSSDALNNYFIDYFVDFTKLIFTQNKLLSNIINNKLQSLMKYLSKYNRNEIINNFKANISHYEIKHNFTNGKFILSLKQEYFTFTDFFLLMTSRTGILTKSFSDLTYPIYILNKTEENVFNNIYLKEKLNNYQENIYLLILDSKDFYFQLDMTINELGTKIYNYKNSIKTSIFVILSFNLIISIIIFIFIFGYITMFFIITYKIIKNINIYLNDKYGDISIKEIMKKKLDNLKLMLSFYEKDINFSINELNLVYSHYRGNYNLKIKEEYKLFRKDTLKEVEDSNKKKHCIYYFHKININKLMNYSGRKNAYLYSLLVIIILLLFFYIIAIINWVFFYKKDDIVTNWVVLCEELVSTSYQLMFSFYIMIFNNQTVDDFSQYFEQKDYISYTFNKLLNLYEAEKYFKSMKNIAEFNEQNINYDCDKFYHNIDNNIFNILKTNYQNEEFQFFFTMFYFCNWSNVMKFKNYKTIILQLFNQLRTIMEDFDNIYYNNIIEYINNINIAKVEVVFLIAYIYLFDTIFSNIKISTTAMIVKIGNNINNSFNIFIFLIIFLIFAIFFIYVRNINYDSKKFIQIRKVFKICNTNE